MIKMQTLEQIVYPYQCLSCDARVEAFNRFCPSCWAGTKFIGDQGCDCCGRPMLGEVETGDICDTCMKTPPLWDRARSVFRYEDNGVRLIGKFKNGDRTHLDRPAGVWLAEAAKPLVCENTLLVPVPQHWWRGFSRRYNQAILLSRRLSQILEVEHCPDALIRMRATRKLGGLTLEQRRAQINGAIKVRPKRKQTIAGRHILLIDDAMVTGTTLHECSKICLEAGAERVSIATLAVVAKDA